ncbi:CBS domain-containing protein [Clostridium oceanicum]|uniref:CBS domain-containing protein n=1 Tax=Clostridium oceanicum TaxID=1543 RepID=A0ABP3ULU8_9CLOT
MISGIMKKNVITIGRNNSVKEALVLMNENNINGTPVVDSDNKVIGMIVKADIYRFLTNEGHYDTCPVDWVMTKKLVTATADEDISVVAKRIVDKDIISLPIVDKNNNLEGIVTIKDVLEYMIDKINNN